MVSKKEVDAMLLVNIERNRKLFPDYEPLSGVGAPGERVTVKIDDFMGGVEWMIPAPMMMTDEVTQIIARHESIDDAIEEIYGEPATEETHEAVVRHFLRERAKYDFYFYAYAYGRIKNKEGGEDLPFKLRPAQIKLIRAFEKMRLAGIPIRIILLKARQWGGSTATQIYMSWIQIMWIKGWNSIIVGHQGDSATEVKDMYVKLINQLPDFLFYNEGEDYDESQPKIKGGGTMNISMIPPRNCKIKTATAMNPEGARGGDSSLAHCTEVAFWPHTEKMDPQKQIKSSCSGVGEFPLSMIVYESTANGQNFFKDEWERAHKVDDYGEKISAFVPVFVAWWEIELYRKEPPSLRKFAETLISRRADKVNKWDYLYWLWTIGATLEGIYWYSQMMKTYKDIQDMQQEYPSDPIEAFKYSGQIEFDSYQIEKRRKYTRHPIFKGEIYGTAPKGEGCIDNLKIVEEDAGGFKIWEMPDKSVPMENRYMIGVDIGGKYKTSDWSVITVIDRADMMAESGVLDEECGPSVVAEWVGHVDPDMLAFKCAQIAHFYNDALLVIENNTAYSRMNNLDTDDVTELFFPNLIPIYDNVYAKHGSELDKADNGASTRWGFNTNKSTKVSIIKYMGICLRDGLWTERDEDTLKQMSWFMKFPNGKYGAIPGKHDDKVMSRAIVLWVSRMDWDRYPVRLMLTKLQRAQATARMHRKAAGASKIMD